MEATLNKSPRTTWIDQIVVRRRRGAEIAAAATRMIIADPNHVTLARRVAAEPARIEQRPQAGHTQAVACCLRAAQLRQPDETIAPG